MHSEVMVMGDLVLLETEINPVMAKLVEGGLEITAVHNHLLRANPATFYMHVGGHGDPVKMATAIHDALAASKTPQLYRPRLLPLRQSISTRANLTRSSASKVKPTGASINSTCHAATRSLRTE